MTTWTGQWPPGNPAWIDLLVPDPDDAAAVYAAVFGWTFEATAAPDGRTYLTATLDGRRVAGLGEAGPDPGGEPAWTVYLATDDVDASVAAAVATGATVLVPTTRAGDLATSAVLRDPTGAVVGLWQSGTHTGADVVDEPGAMTWTEQMSRDQAAARRFYATVFGHTFADRSAPGFTYATFEVGGQTAGGIGELSADVGVGLSPHWLVYFSVRDTDDAVDTVLAHGGAVTREPWDSAFGRVAVVTGATGETFALHAGLEEAVAAGQATGAPA